MRSARATAARTRRRPKLSRRILVATTLLAQGGLFVVAALYAQWEVRNLLDPLTATQVMGRLATAGFVAMSASIGLILVVSTVIFRRYDTVLERVNQGLEREVNDRLAQSLRTRHSLILGLAKLADHRDTDTGKHLDRIATFSCMLAEQASQDFRKIDDDWIECLRLASSLHDIGKVGIPDRVLLKPGALSPEERAIMERHTTIGAETLAAIRDRLGPDPLIDMSLDIAESHHERWDGAGYPTGIGGDDIPLAARIVSISDVYDALTSARVYKPAFPHERACSIIIEGAGTQFDPRLVAAFEKVADRFEIVCRAMHAGEVPPEGLDAAAA